MLRPLVMPAAAAALALVALTAGAPRAAAEPDKAAPAAPAPGAAQESAAQGSTPASPSGAVANAATPNAPAASTPAGDTAQSTPPPASPASTSEPSAAATSTSTTSTPPSGAAPAAGTEATAAPAAPPADPVVAAVRTWLATPPSGLKAHADDLAAAVAFYGARTEGPLWVESSGFTAKAKSAMDEVNKADDWGLSADVFELPNFTVSAPSTAALAEGEARLSLELLKYARHARGGRVNPLSLSRILDLVPPVKDPAAVIRELAAASAPDATLRDLHPKHPQFQLLHKALLAARGPAKPEAEIDPALKVRLPVGNPVLKLGAEAPEVALLRQRLKVPAEGGAKENVLDDKLEAALRAYQAEKGLKQTGRLGPATRAALNQEVDGVRGADPGRKTQLLVLNMERWRWMPEDLGRIYVWNNIPEFMTRTIKDGEVIFKERIIVGLPAWATPVFSAEMEFVGFHPSWGMPDGIKMRELQPRLRAAGGGFLFFGGGAGPLIRAHGLKVYRGGREIDPDGVDWGSADMRQYSFVQPPGPKNPLGMVKFRFPNKHDVYMHDTIEPELFAQSTRAFSHGCIRVQNPKKFAAILLAEGNGLDAAGVARAIGGGGEITLKHRIPVHTAYFTAVADEKGQVATYADIYGHDGKLSAALTGRALRLDPVVETSSAESESGPVTAKQGKKKKKSISPPDTLADVIGGFWLN